MFFIKKRTREDSEIETIKRDLNNVNKEIREEKQKIVSEKKRKKLAKKLLRRKIELEKIVEKSKRR